MENREEIIKALEWCIQSESCEYCDYNKSSVDICSIKSDALALIEELIEENFLLKQKRANMFDILDAYNRGTIDTVRKMQERLKAEMRNTAKYSFGGREYSVIGEAFIDQIAKEMLEG